jgi:hypothetical protein
VEWGWGRQAVCGGAVVEFVAWVCGVVGGGVGVVEADYSGGDECACVECCCAAGEFAEFHG